MYAPTSKKNSNFSGSHPYFTMKKNSKFIQRRVNIVQHGYMIITKYYGNYSLPIIVFFPNDGFSLILVVMSITGKQIYVPRTVKCSALLFTIFFSLRRQNQFFYSLLRFVTLLTKESNTSCDQVFARREMYLGRQAIRTHHYQSIHLQSKKLFSSLLLCSHAQQRRVHSFYFLQ